MQLPWLEIQISRFVGSNPGFKFKGLVSQYPEHREDEVADAVCRLVHAGVIGLNKFKCFELK